MERKFAAQLRQRYAGLAGDVGQTDLLERLFGKQRQKGRDDFFAVGGRRGRAAGGAAGGCGAGICAAGLRAGLRAMTELLHELREAATRVPDCKTPRM